MPIPVSIGLNKGIASFQKCRKDFFREFLSFGNQIDQKSRPKNLPRDGQFFEYWKALDSNEFCRRWSPM